MKTRAIALAACLAAMAAQMGSPAHAASAYDRIYLMAAEGDELYWSVDPNDPGISQRTMSRQCGGTVWGTSEARPCLHGTDLTNHQNTFSVFFSPASLFDAPVSWSADAPLRFHLALHVLDPGAGTVHFGLQIGTKQVESAPATQVSPDVWEGTVTKPGIIDGTSVILTFVRIRTLSEIVKLDLQTAGRSWVDLPEAVAGHSVPELMAQSTYAPAPSTFATPQRSFTFNDDQWSVQTFDGDLSAGKNFDFPLDRDAAIVYAWVEAYQSPLVYDVAHGNAPDQRKATDGFRLILSEDGQKLETGGGAIGKGMDSLAVVEVPAGSLQLTVNPASSNSGGSPYKGYFLEIFGDRTLSSMRWTFTSDSFRTVTVANCPAGGEPVPTTGAVTTFSTDLDWDTAAAGLPKWTLRYDLPTVGDFPCAEAGNSDQVRFTFPVERVWWMGATTSADSLVVSHSDTVFELKVRFWYSPPPVPVV